MKKLLFLAVCLVVLGSCSVMVNLDKRVHDLELGMTRKEAVRVLGKEYNIEVKTQAHDGALEVLHFYSSVSNDYILKFLDNRLMEFHKYVVPAHPEVRVIKDTPHGHPRP